jgi:hypothetical protein
MTAYAQNTNTVPGFQMSVGGFQTASERRTSLGDRWQIEGGGQQRQARKNVARHEERRGLRIGPPSAKEVSEA